MNGGADHAAVRQPSPQAPAMGGCLAAAQGEQAPPDLLPEGPVGVEEVRRAAEAVTETAQRDGLVRPHLIAVTVLTSIDHATLSQIGIASSPEESVLRLAQLAADSGIDGVVASPAEVQAIRANIIKPRFLVVTPGVRPAHADRDDQKRVMTPGGALSAGADYLVIGRPITGAKDPFAAAQAVLAEMNQP